ASDPESSCSRQKALFQKRKFPNQVVLLKTLQSVSRRYQAYPNSVSDEKVFQYSERVSRNYPFGVADLPALEQARIILLLHTAGLDLTQSCDRSPDIAARKALPYTKLSLISPHRPEARGGIVPENLPETR